MLAAGAAVQPGDIESGRESLRAEMCLLAFKQRTTPLVERRIVRVSADAMIDERTGAPCFLAHVALRPVQASFGRAFRER